jgi:hypothetical protein
MARAGGTGPVDNGPGRALCCATHWLRAARALAGCHMVESIRGSLVKPTVCVLTSNRLHVVATSRQYCCAKSWGGSLVKPEWL